MGSRLRRLQATQSPSHQWCRITITTCPGRYEKHMVCTSLHPLPAGGTEHQFRLYLQMAMPLPHTTSPTPHLQVPRLASLKRGRLLPAFINMQPTRTNCTSALTAEIPRLAIWLSRTRKFETFFPSNSSRAPKTQLDPGRCSAPNPLTLSVCGCDNLGTITDLQPLHTYNWLLLILQRD